MAMLRVKGQEVQLAITMGGDLLSTVTDISEFHSTLKLRVLEQGFLGQLSNKHDDIFDGADLSWKMQIYAQDWVTIVQPSIVARAQRLTPDLVFNVTSQLLFADGTAPRVFFPDIKFGPQTTDIGGRGEYVMVNVAASVDTLQFLAA